MGSAPTTVREIRRAQRADGPAAVLAIGTGNPPTSMTQDEYPDYYFRVTNSEHLTELKHKLTRICKRSGIEKRHAHLDEDAAPRTSTNRPTSLPSIDARCPVDLTAARPRVPGVRTARRPPRRGPSPQVARPVDITPRSRLSTYSALPPRPERGPSASACAEAGPPPRSTEDHTQPQRLLRRRQGRSSAARQGARA
ncbi:hypothetical protein PR202_ga25196 [Eleusine coracana subsp. coracana]|uniref:Chalcone/stilbene synthase N-terminal domain-containing protein n=1 Tax=Eleusine coracana subsp. coracana TaxID=191504 RepID=A0AAV5DAQ2_ELECO|nr:hypothetical protein PR202_ga25196 [Eleusine coracana subsp. coracana]